jgi:hypothetical protein
MSEPFPGSAADFYEKNQQLRTELESERGVVAGLGALLREDATLIARLSSALENWPRLKEPESGRYRCPREEYHALLRQARAVTEGRAP